MGTPSGALEREDVLGRRRRRMVACLWRRSCAGHSTHQLQMVLHPSRVDLEDEALRSNTDAQTSCFFQKGVEVRGGWKSSHWVSGGRL